MSKDPFHKKLSYNVFDAISIGICIINSEMKVHFWNEYLEGWTGIFRDDIIGEQLSDFFPSFNDEFIAEQIQNVMDGWPPVIFSSRLHEPVFYNHKNRRRQLIQDIKISPLPTDDDEKMAIISVEDLTEINSQLEKQVKLNRKAKEEILLREKAQKELMASEQKLKELNAMKNQLFSIIGHDLKAPLASLFQLSELFLEENSEKPEIKTEHFKIIHNLSKNSLELLKNLLDWSKVQIGGVAFKPSQINLKRTVLFALEYYSSNAEIKDIQLFENVMPNTFVFADEYMLDTVIRNLIGNAIKFTRRNGNVSVDYEIKDNFHFISVSDNGIGISDEIKENLFSDENIISTTGTNNETGTGLGLILCKKYVEKHSGNLNVESTLNEGTTFTFSLPVNNL